MACSCHITLVMLLVDICVCSCGDLHLIYTSTASFITYVIEPCAVISSTWVFKFNVAVSFLYLLLVREEIEYVKSLLVMTPSFVKSTEMLGSFLYFLLVNKFSYKNFVFIKYKDLFIRQYIIYLNNRGCCPWSHRLRPNKNF